jgi:predicted HNH restriction endonuclease
MGGKCVVCGYDRCSRALEFHHLNPNEKEFTIGFNKNMKFEKALNEAKKCKLVCSNCHREIHDGLIILN